MPVHTHERAPARVSKTARRLFQQMKKTKDELALLIKTVPRRRKGARPRRPSGGRHAEGLPAITRAVPVIDKSKAKLASSENFRHSLNLCELRSDGTQCNATRC